MRITRFPRVWCCVVCVLQCVCVCVCVCVLGAAPRQHLWLSDAACQLWHGRGGDLRCSLYDEKGRRGSDGFRKAFIFPFSKGENPARSSDHYFATS